MCFGNSVANQNAAPKPQSAFAHQIRRFPFRSESAPNQYTPTTAAASGTALSQPTLVRLILVRSFSSVGNQIRYPYVPEV